MKPLISSRCLMNNLRPRIAGLPAMSCRNVHPSQARSFASGSRLHEARSRQPLRSDERLRPDRAYIALGSNLGDRLANIERACKELDEDGLRITRTSSLYETAPMYVEDQGEFMNGVCEAQIEPSMPPLELLAKLKAIEDRMGRHKTIDKGPRNIDLDLLLQGDKTFHDPTLTVPHALMLEREFVLRPLCDLIPNAFHPSTSSTSFRSHLSNLPKSTPMTTITSLSATEKTLPSLRALSPTRPTHIMAILNLTPDSFSDGSLHNPTSPSGLLPLLNSYLAASVSIIDIGGQSTAPRAPEVSADEETARVVPAIRFIRSRREFDGMAISIDTYRASVAAAAVEAGADIVNDVSAGTLDAEMLPTVARLGCTYVMMHMRGTPATMFEKRFTAYPRGVLETVGEELEERVQRAMEAGIMRWRIVLDPGVGFAKTQAGNLQILGGLGQLREREGLRGLPWLVGASRKGFVGKITGVKEPRERTWGTAATVSAAVQGGADIVRVHDVEEMGKVAKMSDAIWRQDLDKDTRVS